MMTTTTTTSIATSASEKPTPPTVIPPGRTVALRDAINVELAAKSSVEMGGIREILLSLEASDEAEAAAISDVAKESAVLMFIAVDHANPARFEPAVVKAEPGFDYTDALSGSAVVRSNHRGFEFTFYIDQPCEHVTGSFVFAVPQFGILERAGQLFVGVRLGDLQSFAALTVNVADKANVHLSMESSAPGNGVMLELVNCGTGERMYPRFVLLPRKFMSALRRAIARQTAAPSQLPLGLQLATHYGATFDADNGMADCWAAARHISVGKDCPVQTLWIRAFDNIAFVDLLASGS